MEKYLLYLSSRRQVHLDKSNELALMQRKDESNHEKIKANIYEICHTTYTALKSAGRENEYHAKLLGFKASWESALELANRHNSIDKAMTEEIKLSVICDIIEKLSITEEKQ